MNLQKTIFLSILLFGQQNFKLTAINKPVFVDLKVQLLNDKKEPMVNYMVLIIRKHHLPVDTIYTDSQGYFKYTYETTNPYCARNLRSGIKNALYRRKKISVGLIINSKKYVVKIRHKNFDYHEGDQDKKIFVKTLRV